MIHLYTNIERSIYYWLSNLFSSSSFIKVVDSFPMDKLDLPTISLDSGSLELEDFELGSRKGQPIHVWRIDVFAENKTQRNDYAYLIIDELESRIPVFDYNYGFPPSVTPPQLGVLIPYGIKYVPIKVFPELVDKLFWRGQVVFYTLYERI